VPDFDQLTSTGRLRRLRGLASAALDHYDLGDSKLALLADSFNTLFRVTTAGGTYVLRVGPQHRIHAVGSAQAESDWTDDLVARGLPSPRVVASRDGSPSLTVGIEGVPGLRECMVLTWTPGRTPARPVSTDDARALATLSARLHSVSPGRNERPVGVLDGRSVLLFELPDLLSDLPEPDRTLFGDARSRAQFGIATLWRQASEPPRLLHGDLTPNNVVRNRDGLTAIDFQDMTWGQPEQDVANSLFGLARDDGDGRLAAAYRESYAEVSPWPGLVDDLLEDLFAARRITMVNLALALRRPGLSEYLARHAEALRVYLGSSARH
jgi:Ser/Thr protein kinase RdoA (MazF antagonist)